MEDVTLSRGDLRMVLRPEWGGRVRELSRAGRDILHPLQGADETFDPTIWPKGGAYPLFPFHNRISQGRFKWDGREVQLPLHPHEAATVHGHGHKLPWQVVEQGPDMVELRLSDQGDGVWPFPFTAVQRFQLTQGGLELVLSIRNDGDATMPAGLGWHPYFTKCRTVRSDAAREWAMDEHFLPDGNWGSVTESEATTRYLSDWSRVDMELSDGRRLTLLAEEPLSHLVLHDPAGAYTCVEPVSHLANALNLQPERAADCMVGLAPAETLRAGVMLDC
ncbi:hypothetical protein RM190_18675 [Paracoccus sp. CPCC 101403]|uniref:Aldose 1-epimerase n=1 Tax=Paracoccus broussonetiae TaxID=3075834 RepID=A0ABU3EI32_9RHOB|nr:hypothetical protein [Paracoccus sp. CPCC 101403]MDT1063893.1 hypothetical protein [Paracoccus sp. CPCC 101403]